MPRLLPFIALAPALALAACDGMPRDASGTTERIETSRQRRVAVMPSTPDAAPALALLAGYARGHGARIEPVEIHGEHALRSLEEGRVDAVVGHFAKSSPWKTRIALSKPVGREEPADSKRPVLRIARRNGENALVLAIDRLVAETAR